MTKRIEGGGKPEEIPRVEKVTKTPRVDNEKRPPAGQEETLTPKPRTPELPRLYAKLANLEGQLRDKTLNEAVKYEIAQIRLRIEQLENPTNEPK